MKTLPNHPGSRCGQFICPGPFKPASDGRAVGRTLMSMAANVMAGSTIMCTIPLALL